ncbi:MAG: SprT family zinc-dependent metalloprotease [Longimicrobiales bacterium]|nr:SprT family zinc-dependent metalloprotease [Longimicrobiales bacterium]
MTRASPDDPILTALRDRGSALRRIRYRENRSVLLSLGRDGETLNCHACFRDAPPGIVEAIVKMVSTRRDTRARRAALRTLRTWEGTRRGLEAARRRKPRRGRRMNGAETAPVRALFRRFNAERFGGRLPEVPLRVSRRMTRSLGTIRYGDCGDRGSGGRSVVEIAISVDLLVAPNRSLLEDTLLHEMAHAEAWLRHGHRGHGRVWRRIARRVGCRPRAVNDVRAVAAAAASNRNPSA